MKRFDVVTIFPDMVLPYTQESILRRAQKKKLIEIYAHDLRQRRSTDDSPYGGGPGMVMKVEPFDKAVKAIKKKGKKCRVIVMSASGKQFTQADAKRLVKYDQLILLCGRYEGVDARVEEKIADESISVGPYVLTGGELPALTIVDAVARLVPGVLGQKTSLAEESHTQEGQLEYPQYTKPEVYKKWSVPPVLLSGDHKKIEEWRKQQMKKV